MKRLFLFSILAQPVWGAECLFYKEPNRGGTPFEQKSGQNSSYNLVSAWNDQISSVWVKDGYYAVLFEQPKFQKDKAIYLYGTGISFARNTWLRTVGVPAEGGATFNLDGLAFHKLTSSLMCLKE